MLLADMMWPQTQMLELDLKHVINCMHHAGARPASRQTHVICMW